MNSEPILEPSLLHRALISDAERLSRMLRLPIIEADPLAESDNAESQRSMALSTDEFDDGGIKDSTEDRYNSVFTRDVPDVSDIRRYVRALLKANLIKVIALCVKHKNYVYILRNSSMQCARRKPTCINRMGIVATIVRQKINKIPASEVKRG